MPTYEPTRAASLSPLAWLNYLEMVRGLLMRCFLGGLSALLLLPGERCDMASTCGWPTDVAIVICDRWAARPALLALVALKLRDIC